MKKIVVIGVIILFIVVVFQPAFAVENRAITDNTQIEEDCDCQKVDRHNPIMVKLLLNKLKVFTNILLSRFGHNPEVKEKCQELLGAINSFDPLSDNPRIICVILAGLNIFFGTIYEKIEEYLDKSFDEDPLLIALLKWLILSPFWTASGVISAAFFALGVFLWCWDYKI